MIFLGNQMDSAVPVMQCHWNLGFSLKEAEIYGPSALPLPLREIAAAAPQTSLTTATATQRSRIILLSLATRGLSEEFGEAIPLGTGLSSVLFGSMIDDWLRRLFTRPVTQQPFHSLDDFLFPGLP